MLLARVLSRRQGRLLLCGVYLSPASPVSSAQGRVTQEGTESLTLPSRADLTLPGWPQSRPLSRCGHPAPCARCLPLLQH